MGIFRTVSFRLLPLQLIADFSVIANTMKVYDLCCEHGHRFEGWFSSEDDFIAQSAKLQIACPVCGSSTFTKLLSAPRLNLSGARAPTADPHPALAAPWIRIARELMAHTVDVGDRFAEEARRIHYDEAPRRGIRGIATQAECRALAEEGIEVAPLPIPAGLNPH